MPVGADFSFTRSGIGMGNVQFPDAAAPDEKPGFLDTLTAAARQTNTVSALTARLLNGDPDLPDDPDFDPLDHLQGFEDQSPDVISRLLSAESPSQMQGIKNRVREELSDKGILARSGATGVMSGLTMGLLDPSFLVAAAVPEIVIANKYRQGRILTEAARGVTATAAYEGALQPLQETRTATEGGINLAAGTLLSAALGGIGRRVPLQDMTAAREAVESVSTVGASSARRAGTLAEETLVAGQLSKAMSKVPLIATDADLVMNADSAVARSVLHDLADIPGFTEGNMQGVVRQAPVELNVHAYDAQLANLSDDIATSYAKYAQRVPKANRVSRDDYAGLISDALRNGDTALIPEAQGAVNRLRQIFDEPFEYAKKSGMIQQLDSAVVGSETYFRRMYDQDVIRNNLPEWKATLERHFLKEGVELAEVRAAVNDVTDKILHSDVGQANWATQITVGNAGPLKERTLDIPDSEIRKYLVNDPLKVAKAYVRDLAPRVELHKRFGDADMKQQLQNIADDYATKEQKLRESGADNEVIKKLLDNRKQAEEAIIRVRDRVLNKPPIISTDKGRDAVKAVRAWRNYVATTKLGGVALTGGLMDTARIAAQYGFAPTIGRLAKLVSSSDLRNVSKTGARRAGAMVEVALARRLDIAAEGSQSEGWSRQLAAAMYKYTGLSHITDFNRILGASLFEDSMIRAANKVSSGKRLTKYEIGKLASMGFGEDELKRMAAQVQKHGGEIDGVNVSGSAYWDDTALAQAYDRAVLKESKQVVQQPGMADRVWWMDSEVGKTLGQIKTFSLSSYNRLLTPGLQMAGAGAWGRFARFAGFMMMGGYLTHVLRSVLSGKEPDTSPSGALGNAWTESGLAGILPDLIDPPARLVTNSNWGKRVGAGEFFGATKYADRSMLAAYGGPALGTAEDTWSTFARSVSGDFTANDLHAIRRNLPLQNVWFMRRPINALEGELAESMNMKGYDSSTFGERLLRTEAVK